MREINFSETQDLVLEIFYLMAKQGIESSSSFEKGYFVEGVSDFFVEKAVEGLRDRKLITGGLASLLNQTISAKGIERIERERRMKGTFLNKNFDRYVLVQRKVRRKTGNQFFGANEIVDAYGLELKTGHHLDFIPASDRIVPLDHNRPEYKKAIEAITNLQTALDKTNYYKENEPNDFTQRSQELKALSVVLAAPQASVSKIEVFGYGTLVYLANKFADEPVGELAKLAWEFIKALVNASGGG